MNLTFHQILKYFEERLGEKIQARERVAVCCPIHGDKHASATAFLTGNGGFNCHACGVRGSLFAFEMAYSQCDYQTALKNIAEITGADPGRSYGDKGVCIACYDYRDAGDRLVFQKRRFKPAEESKKKVFGIYRQTDGNRWVSGLADGTPRVLYNLSDVITANIVFVVEGEKDAENLKAIAAGVWPDQQKFRIATTCNFEGAWQPDHAAKWLDRYSPYLAGKQVFVFEDNDESGRTWTNYVCNAVAPFADSIRRVDFRDLEEHADASDCLGLENGRADLFERIRKAKRWVSDDKPSPEARKPFFEPYNEFISRKSPQIDWMVNGFIQRGANGVFVAEPKGGKSFAVADLVQALATGTSWLGFDIPRPVKAGLVSREDNPDLTRWRLAHLQMGRSHTVEQRNLLDDNIYMNTKDRTPSLMLDNEDELRELIAAIKQRQLEIMFLDVFNILHSADENDNSEMVKVMAQVRRIYTETGCMVGLVHHFNKLESGSLSKRIRGASAIAGWAEWIAGIKMIDEPTKTREMTFEIKAGPSPDPIAYNIISGGEVDPCYLSLAQVVLDDQFVHSSRG